MATVATSTNNNIETIVKINNNISNPDPKRLFKK